MIKPTKRKAFNFLRSYFDVLNQLENDKDRLSFLLSLINKQFLNEDPEDLNFIVNLCYESQRHQIESSVKGWERASNDTLATTPPTTPPTTPKEEEEEEEEKLEYTIDEIYSIYPSKCIVQNRSLGKTSKNKKQIETILKKMKPDVLTSIINRYISECKKDQVYMMNFKTFLNNLPDYSEAPIKKQPLPKYGEHNPFFS